MGTSINHGIWRIHMGKMLIEPVSAEGKFDDLHARITGLLQKRLYLRYKDPQVLGDDLCVSDHLADGIRQLFPRSLEPFSRPSILGARRDRIILDHSDKMIDADHIIQPSRCLHPFLPPGKICFFLYIPAVQGISPQLPGLAEGVRRDPSHLKGRQAFLVQQEQLRMVPDVCAVQCHINGNVSYDGDPLAIGVCP